MKLREYFGANIEFEENEDLIEMVQALIVARELDDSELDSLKKAYKVGLMESGDTPSKAGRNSLLEKGVLCQTCHKGSDYTFSVTYPFGYLVAKALNVKF